MNTSSSSANGLLFNLHSEEKYILTCIEYWGATAFCMASETLRANRQFVIKSVQIDECVFYYLNAVYRYDLYIVNIADRMGLPLLKMIRNEPLASAKVKNIREYFEKKLWLKLYAGIRMIKCIREYTRAFLKRNYAYPSGPGYLRTFHHWRRMLGDERQRTRFA